MTRLPLVYGFLILAHCAGGNDSRATQGDTAESESSVVAGSQAPPTVVTCRPNTIVDAPEGSPLWAIQKLNLASCKDGDDVVYFRSDRARAKQVLGTGRAVVAFFQATYHVSWPVHTGLLTAETWAQVTPDLPYGLPWSQPSPYTIGLPETDDNALTGANVALEGHVSAQTEALLAQSGYSFGDAAVSAVYLVQAHELGHGLSLALGIHTEATPPWFAELMASYAAYAFLHEKQPKEALVWSGVLAGYTEALTPPARSLAFFDQTMGAGLDGFLWYQGQFQARVGEVYDAFGPAFITSVQQAIAAQGDAFFADPIASLEEIAPGFIAWRDREFPESTRP